MLIELTASPMAHGFYFAAIVVIIIYVTREILFSAKLSRLEAMIKERDLLIERMHASCRHSSAPFVIMERPDVEAPSRQILEDPNVINLQGWKKRSRREAS